MVVINGWTVLAHPLFLAQLDRLTAAVEALKQKRPNDFQASSNAKLLAVLEDLVFYKIPANPTLDIYRQGTTLGKDKKHWFRAKFGNARFRLFFRYHSESKIIIFAWVNDQDSLRTYGSKTDAYQVFKEMLRDGNPPDDWTALLKASSAKFAVKRIDDPAP